MILSIISTVVAFVVGALFACFLVVVDDAWCSASPPATRADATGDDAGEDDEESQEGEEGEEGEDDEEGKEGAEGEEIH